MRSVPVAKKFDGRRMNARPALALLLTMWCAVTTGALGAPPAPTHVTAEDFPWDDGTNAMVRWSFDSAAAGEVAGFRISRKLTADEIALERSERRVKAAEAAYDKSFNSALEPATSEEDYFVERDAHSPTKRQAAIDRATAEALAAAERADSEPLSEFRAIGRADANDVSFKVTTLTAETPYEFRVTTLGADDSESAGVDALPVTPERQAFVGERVWLFILLVGLCSIIIGAIALARGGFRMKVRRIAGLDAVDEAIGRATEMGRPVLFIPGIQDMDNVQTVAGVTILSRVAKTAAEYDAKIEVPTSRSLVMTACRDAVQGAYYAAGRPEAYNPEAIRYITDEQFGYVAYVAGRMVREKPATCIYMGQFYAESLLLSENGNAIHAIQIAGTAETSQLPFFVAACDYTLIGEEFFAASAYLSGEPTQLGSLFGQDIGKMLAMLLIIIGVTLATLGALYGGNAQRAADYLAQTVLKQ